MSSLLSSLFPEHPTKSTVFTALALGAALGILLPESRSLFSWFRLHFLHRSQIHSYHHLPSPAWQTVDRQRHGSAKDSKPWALVTGASDGIGYGFVEELAAEGFSIILHGRNASKIDGLIDQLRRQWPDRSYESFICDATDRASWNDKLDTLLKWLNDYNCNLTILVNNIGGNPNNARSFTPLAEYTAGELTALIDMNATFPAQVTRALLPILQRNEPSLILNMASAAGTDTVTLPFLVGYSGAKALSRQFSKSLRMEMVAMGHGDVEVISIIAAKVQSGGMKTSTSWDVPSSRAFARSVLQKVGSGRDEIMGWWSHSTQIWGMGILPDWIRERVLVDVGTQQKKEMEGISKKES